MPLRQEVFALEPLMNAWGHGSIRRWSRAGLDVGDQARSTLIAGLGEVHLVADPLGGSLLAQMRFQIVGRTDEARGRWDPFLLGAPAECLILHVVLLYPDPTQDLHRWHVPQPRRCRRTIDGREQDATIAPDTLG